MKKSLYLNLPHWLECESFVVLVEFIAHNMKLDIMIIVQIQSASSGSGKIGFSSSVGSTGSRVTKATSYQRILNKVKEPTSDQIKNGMIVSTDVDNWKKEKNQIWMNWKKLISRGLFMSRYL